MRKRIIIEEITNEDKSGSFNNFFEWLLYMIGYAIVLIGVSILFKENFYINNQYFGMYAFWAAVIIYVLNKTIKPILVFLTFPITVLTMGLFYPIINVLILNITSFILMDNFILKGYFVPVIIAIVISIFNMLMEKVIIKNIICRKRRY